MEGTEALEPVGFDVTEQVVQAYHSATGHARLAGDADAPPTLASVYTYGIIAQLPVRQGAILAGQRFRFHHRVRIGDRLVTKAAVTDRYEKRSRQYMVLETRTTNQDGHLVLEGRLTRIVPDTPAEDER